MSARGSVKGPLCVTRPRSSTTVLSEVKARSRSVIDDGDRDLAAQTVERFEELLGHR
jgi:hypothetical protein